MFDINTSRDFMAKLEADFADFLGSPGSPRLALNCAMTAYHLHEWVWGDWLKADDETRRKMGISKNIESFLSWIDQNSVWFSTVQELTNGAKHFRTKKTFEAILVGAPAFSWDTLHAGFDEGSWDRPAPSVPGTPDYLVIDYGQDAGEHRWKPAGFILEVIVRFWRDFFEKFAPPISGASTEAPTL